MLGVVAGNVSRNVVPFERRRLVDASAAAPPAEPLVLPRARKPAWSTLAALGIATGLLAIALGTWAILSDARSSPAEKLSGANLEEALAILTASDASRVPLQGSVGRITLVATPDDRAALALDGLNPAPAEGGYEAWVVPPGSATPAPAGMFDGTERVVLLTRPVPSGTRVGVTLEREEGAGSPSRPLRLVATRP